MSSNLVYGFDFFDTIVHRNCAPEVILYEWAKKVSRFLRFQIDSETILNNRKQSGRVKREDIVEEIDYKELIRRLYVSLDITSVVSFDDFFTFCINEEINIEKKHISFDEDCVNYIKALKTKGLSIVIISDFYLGQDFFKCILKEKQLDELFIKVFVSSDIGKRKSTGSLYYHVLKDLRIYPSDLIMNGDNRNSDLIIPNSIGIKTNYRPYNSQNANSKSNLKELENSLKKILLRKPIDDSLHSYSCEILYFIDNLYETLIKNNYTKVLFCSREGQLIKRLFDIYQINCWGDTLIDTRYFYISRRSILSPALKDLDEEDFNLVFRQFSHITLNDFLNSIGFSRQQIVDIANEMGVQIDIAIDSQSDILQQLRRTECFISQYDEIRETQKDLFLEYFSSFGFGDDDNRIAIVDIGWKGTIQDCLRVVIPAKYSINGYYLGLRANQYSDTVVKDKKGLLFSDADGKNKEFKVLERGCIFYEKIFSADHGPVIGYQRNANGGVEPIIDNSIDELRLYEYICKYQQGLVSSISDMIDIVNNSPWRLSDIYGFVIKSSILRQCFCTPRIWKIVNNSYSLSKENFGGRIINQSKPNMFIDLSYKFGMLFVDELYKFLDIHHLALLYPLAHLYSFFVYLLKRILLFI